MFPASLPVIRNIVARYLRCFGCPRVSVCVGEEKNKTRIKIRRVIPSRVYRAVNRPEKKGGPRLRSEDPTTAKVYSPTSRSSEANEREVKNSGEKTPNIYIVSKSHNNKHAYFHNQLSLRLPVSPQNEMARREVAEAI